MKVAINAINLSVSDGWWAEGYDGTNGWVIGPAVRDLTEEVPVSDEADANALFALLEESTIPLFYERDSSGIPQKWVRMAKRSMETLVPVQHGADAPGVLREDVHPRGRTGRWNS